MLKASCAGDEDTYHIANYGDIGVGVWTLWRELARGVVEKFVAIGLDGGLALSRIEAKGKRFYFVVVVKHKG